MQCSELLLILLVKYIFHSGVGSGVIVSAVTVPIVLLLLILLLIVVIVGSVYLVRRRHRKRFFRRIAMSEVDHDED